MKAIHPAAPDRNAEDDGSLAGRLQGALLAQRMFLHALREMHRRVSTDDLRGMMSAHLVATEAHLAAFEEACEGRGLVPCGRRFDGWNEIIGHIVTRSDRPYVRDAAIAAAVARWERYEISAHRALAGAARAAGDGGLADVAERVLDRETELADRFAAWARDALSRRRER